jgi:uncharacterized membrane protein
MNNKPFPDLKLAGCLVNGLQLLVAQSGKKMEQDNKGIAIERGISLRWFGPIKNACVAIYPVSGVFGTMCSLVSIDMKDMSKF